MPDDPHSRDTALARLVAEALLRSKSRQAEHSSACPDAEVLATYAEHALTEEEPAQRPRPQTKTKSHKAICPRRRRWRLRPRPDFATRKRRWPNPPPRRKRKKPRSKSPSQMQCRRLRPLQPLAPSKLASTMRRT